MEDNKRAILICGKGDCCPGITLKKTKVEIKDDFGGKVKLSPEQFSVLKEKIRRGEI